MELIKDQKQGQWRRVRIGTQVGTAQVGTAQVGTAQVGTAQTEGA